MASQLEIQITGYMSDNEPPRDVILSKDMVLSSICEVKELRDNDWLQRKLQTIKIVEEILAVIWSIDYFI